MMLHLQLHEELVAKTRKLLVDELNALMVSDTILLSSVWRTIVLCCLQRLCCNLVRAFGTTTHHGGMGTAERVDLLVI